MGSAFAKRVNDLDEEGFQALYGRWDPLDPAEVAELFSASTSAVWWWIAGGRPARLGAPARHHDDTDVAVRIDDLARLRTGLSDWQLWEATAGRCAHCCPATPSPRGATSCGPGGTPGLMRRPAPPIHPGRLTWLLRPICYI